jgi:hypothetical protein
VGTHGGSAILACIDSGFTYGSFTDNARRLVVQAAVVAKQRSASTVTPAHLKAATRVSDTPSAAEAKASAFVPFDPALTDILNAAFLRASEDRLVGRSDLIDAVAFDGEA